MSKMKKPPKTKKKKSPKDKAAFNAKMLAIAIIFVMLFVSFAVIITTQEGSKLSKDMVFEQDPDEEGTYYGSVKNVNIDLSNVKMKIKDKSANSENSTTSLTDKTVLETPQGNFNITYFDRNSNGKLDAADDFLVKNAFHGDVVRLTLKSSNTELAFYTFSDPF
jgi:hypothetical protein